MRTTPQLEIPTDVRKITEKSVEQVKTAITGYLHLFQSAVPGDVGWRGTEQQSPRLCRAQCRERFRVCTKAGAGEGRRALTKLQMDFIHAQMQAMTEEAKDLSETTTKAVMDSAKTPTKGGPSS